jgi:hypothetical protein
MAHAIMRMMYAELTGRARSVPGMTSELAVEVAALEKSYGPAAVTGLVRRDHRGILRDRRLALSRHHRLSGR